MHQAGHLLTAMAAPPVLRCLGLAAELHFTEVSLNIFPIVTGSSWKPLPCSSLPPLRQLFCVRLHSLSLDHDLQRSGVLKGVCSL